MKKKISLAALLLMAGLSVASALAPNYTGQLPDPVLSPGARRIESTVDVICDPNFHTGEIRKELKHSTIEQVYTRYGLKSHDDKWCASNDREHCEIDHIISLELGGSNDVTNLFPQPYHGDWNAHDKDKLENELHRRVCKTKQLPLGQAQDMISKDWIAAYKSIFGDKK